MKRQILSMPELFNTYPTWMELLRSKTINLFEKYSLPRWMVFFLDSFAVLILFFIACLLRFNFRLGDITFTATIYQAFITLIVYSAIGLSFRSYSGLVRHTTLTDITLVFFVATVSTSSLLLFSLLSRSLDLGEKLSIPISILLIQYVLVSVILSSNRIFIKLIFRFATGSMNERKHVLIYGAGEMGFLVKRVISSDPQGYYDVAGFIDKNRRLQGKKINNIPVFSPKVLTTDFLLKHKISTLVIAIRDLSPNIKRELIRTCMELGLETLETPAVEKWLNGQFQLRQLQKVRLEDLLGRDPIQLNMDLINKGLNNKVILVTGAAGSIGSEIVRQLIRFNIKRLILIDQAESSLFYLENELKSRCSQCPRTTILADITQPAIMEGIFQKYHPEVIFHAAAYKHVPLMEENPHEAIRVNIGGTKLMTKLSVRYGVKKFVMISTDKAVNPTNVMGASKRICEIIIQLYSRKPGVTTQFITTRFGNVLGSNGSVIPIFARQIENGGPITVTHPEVTRYFMTIPEACQLVLEAGFMGNGGEIFIFDMGNPVKIADLAEQMIRLSGLIPEKDIRIVFTGLRPGEKLYEELLTDKETTKPTFHPKIKIANVENSVNTEFLLRIENLLGILYSLSKKEVVDYCKELVPEFTSSNENYTGYSERKITIESENIADKDILAHNLRPSDNRSQIQP